MPRAGYSVLAYAPGVARRSETICDLINVNWLAWVFCTVVAAGTTGVTTALVDAMPELSSLAKVPRDYAAQHCSGCPRPSVWMPLPT